MCKNTRQEQALSQRLRPTQRGVPVPGALVHAAWGHIWLWLLANLPPEEQAMGEESFPGAREKQTPVCVEWRVWNMSRKHCLDWGIGLSLSALLFLYVPCAVIFSKKDISTQGFPQCNGGSMWAFGLLTASAPLQPSHTPVKCSVSSETLVNKMFTLKKYFTSFWKKIKL